MNFKVNLFRHTYTLVTQVAKAHRKPRWIPVAKSKIYRIPKRPVIPEEERLELQRINNNYKTQIRAIRRFYHEEMIKEKSSLESASSEMSQQLEAEEWEKCVKLNEKWNLQVAAERKVRRKAELEAMENFALRRIETKDRELKEKIAKASEDIRREMELSATFITPETLEEAIDQALANPVDYNYAIDLQGNIFSGRDTPIKYEKRTENVKA